MSPTCCLPAVDELADMVVCDVEQTNLPKKTCVVREICVILHPNNKNRLISDIPN